ncbi:MAG TPA: potassium/proton antiporter [Armatimonadota bacterium]|jgi:cell volume regulation protein A|nr:potassium/proton antiporter [Armatimonadota bacterium]HOJ21464.1 potassium/proton antiporter [Armatimonadota bacterium]HOM81503.1 potassium/proton antiporter [Armatimonadota bacterium]HOQ28975.1 potassium/proton antiporter [Armatimonadota bacterium]HPO74038.1 potassium/proton antiporter [Armatimonadota bacterium]
MTVEYILVGVGGLLLLSVVASKGSSILGVPALLIFLMIGMLAGCEGPGGIAFDDARLSQGLGVVALIFILFAGGLSTEWRRVHTVLWPSFLLATLGVLITAVLLGGFAVAFLGLTPIEAFTLGAIVSSTDAAAVFAVMRSRNVHLKEHLETLLEFESGSNDPMAVLLTVSMIRLLTAPDTSPLGLVPFFVQQMILGSLLGYLSGRAIVWIINRINLEYDGLYPVLSTTLILLVYALTSLTGGSGILAVYIAGLVMGNSTFLHKNSLTSFHDGLAWLMQIVMFLTLGLLVYPSRLLPLAGIALGASLFLMFVARPVAVFLSLIPFKFPRSEKMMISWVGLRGAVPIILATYPLLANFPNADAMFHVVFFVVFTSVLIQGPSLPWLARRLRVDRPPAQIARELPSTPAAEGISGSLVEIAVPPGSPFAGRPIVELGLPRGVYIVLVRRGEEMVVPAGSTLINAGDRLLMMGKTEALDSIRSVLAPVYDVAE